MSPDQAAAADSTNTPGTGSVLVRAESISKRFGGVTALENVSLSVQRGEVHGLVGENGAGKSTLMNILAGVITGYEGTLYFDGEPRSFSGVNEAENRGIRMIHQELGVIDELTIAENMFLGNHLTRNWGSIKLVDWSRMYERAHRHIEKLGGYDLDPREKVGALPHGLKQVVEIARVVFAGQGAELIIMDEPTSALSEVEKRRLFGVVEELKQNDQTIIFISHFLEDVMEVSDQVSVLRGGRKVDTLNLAETDVTKADLIQRMVGGETTLETRSSTTRVKLSPPPDTPVILSTKGLTTGNVRGVDLDLHEGEILGLHGLMGAGQAEVGKALFGLVEPEEGQLNYRGEPVQIDSPTTARSMGIGYLPSERSKSVFLENESFKTVTLPNLSELLRESGHRFIHRPTEVRVTEKQVERFKIRMEHPLNLARSLSGGNQQKLALSKWLTTTPTALILEEPTRGVDVAAKSEIVRIIRDLREKKVGIVVISEEPATILDLCDRVVTFKEGRVADRFEDRTMNKDTLLASTQ